MTAYFFHVLHLFYDPYVEETSGIQLWIVNYDSYGCICEIVCTRLLYGALIYTKVFQIRHRKVEFINISKYYNLNYLMRLLSKIETHHDKLRLTLNCVAAVKSRSWQLYSQL